MADPRSGVGSAGTRDTRVDRPEEGLPGIATVENTTPETTPSRASFDSGKATGFKLAPKPGVIDTTWTQGGPTDAEVAKRS